MKVYCIIGDERVFRLKSPSMFSVILKRAGIKGTYVSFKVGPEQIGQAIQSLRVLHIAGANITVPYKEVVIPYLDVLSEGARFIGAVNTIVPKGDLLKGYNTNAIGFMDALNEAGFDVAGKSVSGALMMMAAHEALHSLPLIHREPDRLFDLANRRLYGLGQRKSFVALAYLTADAR